MKNRTKLIIVSMLSLVGGFISAFIPDMISLTILFFLVAFFNSSLSSHKGMIFCGKPFSTPFLPLVCCNLSAFASGWIEEQEK